MTDDFKKDDYVSEENERNTPAEVVSDDPFADDKNQPNTDYYGRHECGNPYERHENADRYDKGGNPYDRGNGGNPYERRENGNPYDKFERDNPYVSGSSGYGANGFGGGFGAAGVNNKNTSSGADGVGNPYEKSAAQRNDLYENGEKPRTGMGVASMVLGISSLVCCCVPFFGMITAVIGLILGICSCKKGSNGFGIAGIITSALGIIIGIVSIVAVFVAGAFNWEDYFPFDSSRWEYPSEDSSFDPNTDASTGIVKALKNFIFKR